MNDSFTRIYKMESSPDIFGQLNEIFSKCIVYGIFSGRALEVLPQAISIRETELGVEETGKRLNLR